ncbi:hypothetical protein [Flavobacterium adhaerens]|uniref:hypothetical protein n=1 Tax=Flavobacterium adhaerens TaxID=3149043 RepID=UPI0032B4EE10
MAYSSVDEKQTNSIRNFNSEKLTETETEPTENENELECLIVADKQNVNRFLDNRKRNFLCLTEVKNSTAETNWNGKLEGGKTCRNWNRKSERLIVRAFRPCRNLS